MANSTLPIEPVMTPYGVNYGTVRMNVSSVTAKAGDPAAYSSGYAASASATSTQIIGCFAHNVAATDTTALVYCNPNQLYLMQGSATAALNTQARCGVACDITGSTGAWYLVPGNTSYVPIMIVALAPGETAAVAYAKYIVKPNLSALAAKQS